MNVCRQAVICVVLLREGYFCVQFDGHSSLSSRRNFRASARSGRLTTFALIRLIKYHNAFVILNSSLCNHLALLARANSSLLLLGLSLLIEPLLTNGIFGRVLERVEGSVVVAAVTLEAGCCLCLLDMIDVLEVVRENKLTLIGCSMNRRHGQAGDMSELL